MSLRCSELCRGVARRGSAAAASASTAATLAIAAGTATAETAVAHRPGPFRRSGWQAGRALCGAACGAKALFVTRTVGQDGGCGFGFTGGGPGA